MRLRLLMSAGLALSILGCNGNAVMNGGGQDAGGPEPDLAPMAPDLGDNGMVSTTYPAPHPDAPQVVSGNGPVLKAPVTVPVFFGNDDATQKASLEDFAARLPGATAYWTATTSEYGVGALTALAPAELTETATGPLDDGLIQ